MGTLLCPRIMKHLDPNTNRRIDTTGPSSYSISIYCFHTASPSRRHCYFFLFFHILQFVAVKHCCGATTEPNNWHFCCDEILFEARSSYILRICLHCILRALDKEMRDRTGADSMIGSSARPFSIGRVSSPLLFLCSRMTAFFF